MNILYFYNIQTHIQRSHFNVIIGQKLRHWGINQANYQR